MCSHGREKEAERLGSGITSSLIPPPVPVLQEDKSLGSLCESTET